MQTVLPPVRFTGARILRDGALQPRSLAIADGRITKGPLPEIRMQGYLLLPGLVDMHGTAFLRHVAPRPGMPLDLALALAATDRDAAANGITTGWLTQAWSWEGGANGPDFAERFLTAVRAIRPRLGTDLRVQLQCETHTMDSADRLLSAVAGAGVTSVIFRNSLEHWLDQPDTAFGGPDPAGGQHDRRTMERLAARRAEVPRHLCRLAEAFDARGMNYGSHGDTDGETRETFSMIGATIAEFPRSRQAAAAARAMNDPVIGSALSMLLPAPDAAHPPVSDLVAQGLCDALASDRYYPALAQAAWSLVDSGRLDLPRAWAMISSRPAEIMRLHDRGTLDIGRRADLVAVNEETRTIEMTISGGVLTYLGHGAACRFASGARRFELAAE